MARKTKKTSKPRSPRSKTFKVSWEDFGKSLGIDYDGPDEFMLSDQASQEADSWIKEYEKDADVELSEEQRFAVEDAIASGIAGHWSPENVFPRNIDIDEIESEINKWGERGQQMAIYDGKTMPSGHAIDIEGDESGVTIKLYQPFRTAYAEAAYCVHGAYYGGEKLESFGPNDAGRVYKWISECVGMRKPDLDLDRWDERRDSPRYNDLVKLVEST